VIVATIRALKYHGGVNKEDLGREDLAALEGGFVNLQRHMQNVRLHYGLPCVVAINHFTADTDAEVALLKKLMEPTGVPIALSTHWAHGGAGAVDVARAVVEIIDRDENQFRFVYDEALPLWEKMRAIATRIYGAADISADAAVRAQIARLQEDGYGRYPVCVAKTQYSFSTDAKLRGAPEGHIVNIREVRLAAGAEFVVMICGDVMTMPGLPKVPAAERIDLTEDGRVVGLF
jgi:formate--tetrahydrofolate ligase